MADGEAKIADWISRLRKIQGAEARVVARAGPRVLAWLKQQAAAGLSPNGTAWKLTAKGEIPKLGRVLLLKTARNTITITLGGKSYLHHAGIARGRISRKVLPGIGNTPEPIQEILREETLAELRRTLKG
jgi:hypothetical protein